VKEVDNGEGEITGLVDAGAFTLYASADAPDDGRNFSYPGDTDEVNGIKTVFANADYDLSESIVDGYQLQTNWSCEDAGGNAVAVTNDAVKLDLDTDVTCTISNEALGQVSLLKLTNGLPHDEPQIMTWMFKLYEGVSKADEIATDSAPPAEVDFDGIYLTPGVTYTLCEVGIPAGWTLEWLGDPDGVGGPDTNIEIVTAVNSDPVNPATGYSRIFDPNFVPPPDIYSNEERCVSFEVDVGQKMEFQIDNQFPGGEPRTIGYWKNWNTCSGGGQAETAAKNGGKDEGIYILDDVIALGPTIGVLTLDGDDCPTAVNILDKREVTGRFKKNANDAAYGMAAQLLAAQANLTAGAETCSAIVEATVEGQMLLASIGFDGTGNYLRPKDGQLYTDALYWATILDTYNNGNLCTP
jgi:hypothetical protein